MLLHDAGRQFNIDESGISLSPKINRVLAAKGSRNVPFATSGKEKERITILGKLGLLAF